MESMIDLLRTLIAFQVRLELSEIGIVLYRTRPEVFVVVAFKPGSDKLRCISLTAFLFPKRWYGLGYTERIRDGWMLCEGRGWETLAFWLCVVCAIMALFLV